MTYFANKVEMVIAETAGIKPVFNGDRDFLICLFWNALWLCRGD